MKTEREILARLEKDVEELNSLTNGMTESELAGDLSAEKQTRVNVLVAHLFLLAWVLDCEDVLRPALAAIKILGVAEKLGGEQ